MTGLFEQMEATFTRFAPPDVPVGTLMGQMADQLAAVLGVSSASSVPGVLRQKGIDPDRSMALFIDLESLKPAATEAGRMLGRLASEESGEPSAATSGATYLDPKTELASHAEGRAATRFVEAADVPPEDSRAAVVARLNSGRAAAVIPCMDAQAAEALGQELAGLLNPSGAPEDLQKLGLYHAAHEDWLVLATSEEALEAVQARFEDPADPYYGTRDMPARSATDMVQILEMDAYLALMDGYSEGLQETNPEMAALVDKQMGLYLDEMREILPEGAPAVMTMTWTDEVLAFASRMEREAIEDLLDAYGRPAPLDQVRMFPGEAPFMFTLNLPKAMRDMMLEQMEGAMASPEHLAPEAGQAIGMMKAAFGMMDGAVSFCVLDFEGEKPRFVAAADVLSRNVVTGLLQAAVGGSLQPVETHQGAEIIRMGEEKGGSDVLYLAIKEKKEQEDGRAGDPAIMAASLHLDLLKETLDRLAAENSELPKTLASAADGMSVYYALAMQPSFIDAFVRPINQMRMDAMRSARNAANAAAERAEASDAESGGEDASQPERSEDATAAHEDQPDAFSGYMDQLQQHFGGLTVVGGLSDEYSEVVVEFRMK
jgi:hypothetical protein